MNGSNLESAPGIARDRWNRVWQGAWICCFGVIAWLSLLMLPTVPLAPDLDLSWAGALPYFAHRGFQFGTDVIFTYGPLGHFVGYAYTGYLATERTLWEFVIKGLAAALFCWALRELRLPIRVTLAVCIILFLGNYEEAYAFMIVLTGLMLLRSAERRFWLHALLGLFLAVLALVKFTYFVQGMCAIGCAVGYYAFRRRWLALASLTASFAVGLVTCWKLAGQNPVNLPHYLSNSLAIASGYNEAMFTSTTDAMVVWTAIGIGLLLILQLILFWCRAEDKARIIFGSIFLLLILFSLWKHAFTRWENHALKFFLLFPELLLASWLLTSRRGRPLRWAFALTAGAIVSALVGGAILDKEIMSRSFVRSWDQFRYACAIVTDYAQFDQGRRAGLAESERKFALPRTKAVVANRTVDVMGYRQGIALLNGLNYVPRPIFQGYSAYTPSLIEMNTRHYQSANRPEFVISKLETIDDRFPTTEDSGVILELLYHYRPILSENGWGLWQAAHPAEALQPQLITRVDARLGEKVPVPENTLIWAEFEIRPTRRGRVAAFFYKSAPVFIDLKDDLGFILRYRIVPSMARSGFLLNPEIKNDEELAFAANGAATHHYKRIRISTDPGDAKFFKRKVDIKLFALPTINRYPPD